MSDRILIQGLAIDAVIGVHAWEQQMTRPLLLDLELLTDLRPAGRSDALTDTIDYQAVAELAAAVAAEQPHQLVEHYAERLAQQIVARFAPEAVRLTVHKPGAVARTRTVSVQIERRRSDYAD